MMEPPNLCEGDERVFTIQDVKDLFVRCRKNIFRAAGLGGLATVGWLLLQPITYEVTASFKAGVESRGEGIGQIPTQFLGFLDVPGNQSQGLLTVLMLSHDVLKPLVEHLGLNAKIVPREGIFTKIYRRIRDNVFWRLGIHLTNPLDLSCFENVHYTGDMSRSYWIQFEDNNHFTLLDANTKKKVAEATLGTAICLPDVTFTLIKTPQNMQLHRLYPMILQPWLTPVTELKDRLKIISKQTSSIYELELCHRDPLLAARIINDLMAQYQKYLKIEHEKLQSQQLSYLEERQQQMFQKLREIVEDHVTYLQDHLGENGVVNGSDSLNASFSPLQGMMDKVFAIDVELGRLDQWSREEHLTPPADDGPFSQRVLQTMQSISALKQQKDLLELSLQQKYSLSATHLMQRHQELQEVKKRKESAQTLLADFTSGKAIFSPCSFDPESSLVSWAERLQTAPHEEREDFAEFVENHIRLLSVQEKILQEGSCYGERSGNAFEGMDLPLVGQLLINYNQQIDQCETKTRTFAQLQQEIDKNDFAIHSLNAVLTDPLSQKLIDQATKISLQLKDERYHSTREGQRWEEELAFQKQVLKDHLTQLLKVEELNAGLAKKKIEQLQRVTLNCLYRQTSMLNDQMIDAMKERKEALLQEKQFLEKKIDSVCEIARSALPEHWRYTYWFNLKKEAATQRMQTMTDLVESTTIKSQLHQVASKPLDKATPPKFPQQLPFSLAFLGAFGTGFGYFFIQLLRTILKGFPSSLEKLRALRWPVLGKISSLCDGEGTSEGSDLELLRQMGLFLEGGKIASLIEGRGPDYSYALAKNLARRSLRPLLLRCDFHANFRSNDQPGLLQVWKGEMALPPIRKCADFDLLTTGGYTPYGLEIIQSATFQTLLTSFAKQYDVVFLIFRSPLDTAESTAALQMCDRAIVTVLQEPTELLTPFAHWTYHGERKRLTFIFHERAQERI